MEKDQKTNKDGEDDQILHDFKTMNQNSLFSGKFFVAIIIVVLLGVGGGYLMTSNKSSKTATTISQNGTISQVAKGTILGSDDSNTFKDIAEGILQKGGINGEGQFHLVRPGGDSQNVYLTSSTVDLSQLIGKKIKVWGQTQKAQSAGWLMDVGKVEVLE